MALRNAFIVAPLLLTLAACETAQENPNYKYSSTYGDQAPQALAQNSRHPEQIQAAAPVRYVNTTPTTPHNLNIVQTSSTQAHAVNGTYTRVNHECLNSERTRTLVGAGLGGSAGAIAGNKLIGGTKGTLIGAAAGGIAGYGIGDKTIDCDPIPVQASTQQAIITPAYSPSTHNSGTISASNTQSASYPIVFEPQATTISASNTDYTPSLTEQHYSADTVGTPGYEVFQQSQYQSETVNAAETYQYEAQGVAPLTSAPVTENYAGYPAPSLTALPPVAPQSVVQVATPPNVPSWPEAQSQIGSDYIIKAGDTVYSLSRNLCTSVANIQSLNNLDRQFNIQAGQTLKLPSSEC